MANDLLNALRRKLAAYEGAGLDDEVKKVKAAIAVEEKAAAKADRAEAKAEADAEPEKAEPAKKEKT